MSPLNKRLNFFHKKLNLNDPRLLALKRYLRKKSIFIALSFHMISEVANIYLEYSACCIDNRYDTLCGVD